MNWVLVRCLIVESEELGLKDVELKLISELMKNSRRSDRELAKIIGVSQPTVSRMIKKLEKEGAIGEYTMIPNFSKLGFKILTLVFSKMKREISPDLIEKVRKRLREDEKENPPPVFMTLSGMGCDSDRVFVLLSEDYSTYSRYLRMVKEYPLIEIEGVKSFMIDLTDQSHFRPLTFSSLAKYLEKKAETKLH
jgi:DNA-binding Lrp family transcriptional regulator